MGSADIRDNRLGRFNKMPSDSSLRVEDGIEVTKVREATMTKAGSNLLINANFAYGEGQEYRYSVESWAGCGSSFTGIYNRVQANVAAGGKQLHAMQQIAVVNAGLSIDLLQAAYFEVGMKASGTQTIAYANAAEFSLAPYTGTGAITITNHWECVLLTPSGVASRIDGTNAAKIHGVYLLARDGDGGNTKLGDGFYMGNDTGQSGTRTLTNGVNINIACTTGVRIAGACTTGISLSGACTTGINISGACTKDITLQNGEQISNASNGYVLTDGAFVISGTGGAGVASAVVLSYSATAAASATATMTNAPAAGNPAIWMDVWYNNTKYVTPLFASA